LLLLMGTVTGTVSVVPSRFKIVTVSKAELEDAGWGEFDALSREVNGEFWWGRNLGIGLLVWLEEGLGWEEQLLLLSCRSWLVGVDLWTLGEACWDDTVWGGVVISGLPNPRDPLTLETWFQGVGVGSEVSVSLSI
jgi:hypothetical protein